MVLPRYPYAPRKPSPTRVEVDDLDRNHPRVGAECGYADIGRFSRQFRRVHGRSPSAWRRAVRESTGTREG